MQAWGNPQSFRSSFRSPFFCLETVANGLRCDLRQVDFIERHLTREPRAEPLAGTEDEWERRSEKRKRQVDLGKDTIGSAGRRRGVI